MAAILGTMLHLLPAVLPLVKGGANMILPMIKGGFSKESMYEGVQAGFNSLSGNDSGASTSKEIFSGLAKGASYIGGQINARRNQRTSLDEMIQMKQSILPTPEGLTREGGQRYFPKFEDEYSAMDRINGRDQYMKPLSREQFGNRGSNFSNSDYEGQTFGSFDGGGRQTGFKRPYNVYADSSLGSGFGSTSMITRRNDMTIGGGRSSAMTRMEDMERNRPPASFPDDNFEPSRKFIRRVPSQSQQRNRFQTDRVSNLNLSEQDYSDFI